MYRLKLHLLQGTVPQSEWQRDPENGLHFRHNRPHFQRRKKIGRPLTGGKFRSIFVPPLKQYHNWRGPTGNMFPHALQISGVGYVRLHPAYGLLQHVIGMFPYATRMTCVLFAQLPLLHVLRQHLTLKHHLHLCLSHRKEQPA